MVMSPDGAMIFLQRPVAAILVAAAAGLLLLIVFKSRSTKTLGGLT
jgi:hypothetical protein